MRILFVNAINIQNVSHKVFPNLGLGYIASYLQKYIKDVEIKIIDYDGNNFDELLGNFLPSLVGISSVSQNFDYVSHISRICKNYKIPVLVGGIHISSLPESLPKTCDIGIIGEGEETTLELARVFQEGELSEERLSRIHGIAFRDYSGKIRLTNERKLIENIDELPFPNRNLLKVQQNGFLHLFSSRGCRHRCSFCSNSRFWKKIRLFSADYVFNELNEIVSIYKPKAVTFYDDDFLLDKNRIESLTELIEKSGMNRRMEFNLMTRADNIDSVTVGLLKRINVTIVSLGLESGNQKTLNFLKCGTVSVNDNLGAIKLLNEKGIFTYGFFIIGSPQESKEDIMETLNFIRKSPLSGFSVYALVPYPGTPIWNYAINKNLVSSSMLWKKLALNINETKDDVIIVSEKLSRSELYKLYWSFQGLRRKKHFIFMIKRALRNPGLIFPRFLRSAAHRYGRLLTKINGMPLDRKH